MMKGLIIALCFSFLFHFVHTADLFREATLALQKGQYEQSYQLYEQYMRKTGSSAGTYGNIGYGLQRQGRMVEAFFCYYRALELSADYQTYHSYLVYLSNAVPQWGNLQPQIWAEDRRRRTEEQGVINLLKPKITESDRYTSFISGQKSILKELIDTAQVAKTLNKRARDPYIMVANALQDRDKNEAIRELLAALEVQNSSDDTPDEQIISKAAHLYCDLRQHDNALNLALECSQGGSVVCSYAAVRALCETHKFSQANSLLHKIEAQLPDIADDPEFLNYQANVLSLQGKVEEAIKKFTKLVALGETKFLSAAYHNRGIEYNKVGKYTEAYNDFIETWKYLLNIRWKPARPSRCASLPLYALSVNEVSNYVSREIIFSPTEALTVTSYSSAAPSSPTLKSYSDKKLSILTYTDSSVVLDTTAQALVGGCTVPLWDSSIYFADDSINALSAYYPYPNANRHYEHLVAPYISATTNNYYHFVVEILPRIIYLKQNVFDKQPESIMLIPNVGYTKDVLQIVPLPKDRVLLTDFDQVTAKKITTVNWQLESINSDIGYNYYPPSHIVHLLRDAILTNQNVPGNLIIYTGRSSGARSVSNQKLLIDTLSKEYGDSFVLFEPTNNYDTSISDQIQLFSKAKLVLGPHGAGLTNIVWTPNGTPLIEFPLSDHEFDYFKYLAAILKRDYWIVSDVKSPYEGHYTLNAPKVNSIVKTIKFALENTSKYRDEL